MQRGMRRECDAHLLQKHLPRPRRVPVLPRRLSDARGSLAGVEGVHVSLVRVFEIPPPIGEFVFGGKPQAFLNVDWFRDDEISPTSDWEATLRAFVIAKRYNRGQPLLVLGGDGRAFTINYEAR